MRIQKFLKQHQIAIHKIGLIIAVVLQIIIAFGLLGLSQTVANAITFAVLSYILLDISENTHNYNRNKVYEEQEDMYADVIKYIKEKGAKEAILIQYSGHMVVPLLRKLMLKGAKVELYIEKPDTAISQLQKERIESILKGLSGMLNVPTPSKLTVCGYAVPASLRGILIDDKVLAIGWYIYEHTLTTNNIYSNDKIELSGHDVAGMILYKGSIEYTIFKNMFMNQVSNYDAYRQSTKEKPLLEISR